VKVLDYEREAGSLRVYISRSESIAILNGIVTQIDLAAELVAAEPAIDRDDAAEAALEIIDVIRSSARSGHVTDGSVFVVVIRLPEGDDFPGQL
jgi:hypothetical protein